VFEQRSRRVDGGSADPVADRTRHSRRDVRAHRQARLQAIISGALVKVPTMLIVKVTHESLLGMDGRTLTRLQRHRSQRVPQAAIRCAQSGGHHDGIQDGSLRRLKRLRTSSPMKLTCCCRRRRLGSDCYHGRVANVGRNSSNHHRRCRAASGSYRNRTTSSTGRHSRSHSEESSLVSAEDRAGHGHRSGALDAAQERSCVTQRTRRLQTLPPFSRALPAVKSGLGSTMLTGSGGVDPSGLSLGGSTLLGK
jgi:hypothetical protein